MASIYQPSYKAANGKPKRSTTWHVSFNDHTRTPRRLTGFADKRATVEYARKVEALVGFRVASRPVESDPELARFVQGLPDDVREKLSGWSILDGAAAASQVELSRHLTEWHQSTIDRGVTLGHADANFARVTRLVEGCGFRRYADIDAERVKAWLAANVDTTETRNHYIRALRGFCYWMVAAGKAVAFAVPSLKLVKVIRVRERRALSMDELHRLFDAARCSDSIIGGMTGPERAALYWLAVESGLRANELRTLTVGSFTLSGGRPVVTVKARNAKNRRDDTLSLSMELAGVLRGLFAAKMPGVRAFNVPRRTADMLKADLVAAGIPDKADGGVFDFHALRGQCATLLALGGASVAVAQRRLRHSTVALTMNVYTRLGLDTANDAAIAALPSFAPRTAASA